MRHSRQSRTPPGSLKSPSLLAACLFLASGPSAAHSFGTAYNLPVPFSLYAYGAAATLAVSFALAAYFATVNPRVSRVPHAEARWTKLPGSIVATASALSLGLLVLCIATGLLGTENVYANFNMTFFWLIFALGLLYLTAVIGDVYEFLNPWRVLCDTIASIARGNPFARRYPSRLGYGPAIVLYIAFVWFELFGEPRPFSLAIALVLYSVVTCGGALLFGRDEWFRYGDLFAVMFRLVGRMAPVAYRRRGDDVLASLRKPLAGLYDSAPEDFGLLLFVLFMLSSTAFDGLHETVPWSNFFWRALFPIIDSAPRRAAQYYYYWEWLVLVASPFLYLSVYLVFVVSSKIAASTKKSVRALALTFAFSLIPIAYVYNVTHYFSLLVSQGVQIISIASDPFGLDWNLFGTAGMFSDPIVPDASTVWHVQVVLILVGHVLAVHVSHVEALRTFRDARKATASQLPMLVLMILFTVAGLWVLSLPIAGGQVVAPAA